MSPSFRLCLTKSFSAQSFKTQWASITVKRLSILASPKLTADYSGNVNEHPSEKITNFGFSKVLESEKASRVGQVFSSVAESYDLMNDVMSFGIHRLWKDYFVRSLLHNSSSFSAHGKRLNENKPLEMLDVAGGTGDIALRLLDYCTEVNGDLKSRVTVADINKDMLREGQKRALASPYAGSTRLRFMCCDGENLEKIPSNSIDLYTIAFGIRNFTEPYKALREAWRVLRPGGVFACLEFTPRLVNMPLLNPLYKTWSFSVIPLMGQLVANDRESYQYLVESIDRFPDQICFHSMIRSVGFIIPEPAWEDLSLGVAAIHKGIKPLVSDHS